MELKIRIENLISEQRDKLREINSFVFGTTMAYRFFMDRYSELLSHFDEDHKGMIMFKELNEKIPEYDSEIYVTAFINYVARTEAFLNAVLEALFLWNKNSLISNKQLSYREIVESEHIDDLIRTIREKEILEFSHSSFKGKIRYLKKNFNLSFPELDRSMEEIIEMFTTRNIILHNNGIVNETYLEENETSNLMLGSKRVISDDYSRNVYHLSVYIAISVGEQIKKKIKDETESV